MSEAKVPVIYIASYSFSGSTLLDLILGGHSKLLSSGELLRFNSSIINYAKKGCTCGMPEDKCEYWISVREEFNKYMRYHGIREDFSLPQINILNKYQAKAPDQFGVHTDYEKSTYYLMKSMLKISGKEVIIDSSKTIPRLLVLLNSDLFDTRIIYLQKIFEGTMYSIHKRGQSTVKNGIKWYFYYKMLMDLIKKYDMVHKSYLIKFEDLLNTTDDVINELSKFLEIEFSPNMLDITAADRHIIGGNRMRYDRERGIDSSKIKSKNLNLAEKILKFLLSNEGYLLPKINNDY